MKNKKLKIDISLNNNLLYYGCKINEIGGKLNLLTPPADAINIIGRNFQQIIVKNRNGFKEIILTGSMAIWAYLVVFHIAVHLFVKVWYEDGLGNKLLIAAHGS